MHPERLDKPDNNQARYKGLNKVYKKKNQNQCKVFRWKRKTEITMTLMGNVKTLLPTIMSSCNL